MATLEKRRDGYRVIFYFRNERFTRSLKTDVKTKADELRRRLEGNLKLLEQGRLEYVPGQDDLATVLLTDGHLTARVKPRKLVTVGEFFQQYQSDRPPGKEANTSYTEDIHIEHLKRHFGSRTPAIEIPDRLQSYVNARSTETSNRGESISQVTIMKELGTLRSIWNRWGMRQKLVFGPLSLRQLEYPKAKEKPPFQTWTEIERKTKQGASQELWDSLYLRVSEIDALLEHVRSRGSIVGKRVKHFPFMYPMFVFAAHTGARRSEMMRSRIEDFDFDRGDVTIREKKKDRRKEETYRHVPLSGLLLDVMRDWVKRHPGGDFTFCKTAGQQLTEQMAQHHFRWALAESKWDVIRGWHCLRHSFVSNLASCGVDQRVIMDLVGHLNAETTKRYMHLFPSVRQDAIKLVFQNSPVR